MRGVVVAPQPIAAEIGADLLAGGGNAFDAAIGTAFAQMVVDPQMCGLGGFGCATYAWSGGCQHLAFHARAGSRATEDMWAKDFGGRTELGSYTLFDDHRSNLGHTSVGTPGVVAGLARLHSRARLPWAELIEPAAALARRGFPAPRGRLRVCPTGATAWHAVRRAAHEIHRGLSAAVVPRGRQYQATWRPLG